MMTLLKALGVAAVLFALAGAVIGSSNVAAMGGVMAFAALPAGVVAVLEHHHREWHENERKGV